MKRTPLKRKTPLARSTKPMKRTGIKRKSTKKSKKLSVSKAKEDAWNACSRFIRYRDSYQGYAPCCTCDKILPITGKGCIQAGHFIPGRSNAVLYIEHNIHSQCVGCNVMRDGAAMLLDYEDFMLQEYDQKTIDDLKIIRNDIVPMTANQHKDMELYFKKELELLCIKRGESNPWE